MTSNLISSIKNRYDEFSKGQKRIGDYIIQHHDKAAFMTAHRLGETTGVSESTVVRFAAELGYDGYPQLQKAMQELIRSKLNSMQRIEVTRSRMTSDEVPVSIMGCDVTNIRQTLDEISGDTFRQAVDDIAKARRVYIFGAGSCRALAVFMTYYMKMLLVDVQLIDVNSETEIFRDMLHIDSRDVAVGISFPRYSTRAIKAMHFAHERNATVISITDSETAPIAEYARYLLLAHSDMATIVDSLVAPLSLINAIIVAISLKKEKEITKQLTELEELWEEHEVYQKYEL